MNSIISFLLALSSLSNIFYISSMKYATDSPGLDILVRFSLVNNLKSKIEALKQEVHQQKQTIEAYKKSTKTTLINEQQIQIQKLNDENKRLLLIIEEMKSQSLMAKQSKTSKNMSRASSFQNYSSKKKQVAEQQVEVPPDQPINKQKKKVDFETKYYQVLLENEKMRKELIVLKANETMVKHRKPLNERSSILMENNIHEGDKIRKKCYELEAELSNNHTKIGELKKRITELEQLLERALQINKSMKII